MPTGYLHLKSFDSPGDHKNIPPKRVGYFYVFNVHFRCRVSEQLRNAHPSTSLQMRPDVHGISHGLINCPPDT